MSESAEIEHHTDKMVFSASAERMASAAAPAADHAEPDKTPDEDPEDDPIPETGEHHAYMKGVDGFFYPDRLLTRAETAQILDNLFCEEDSSALPDPEYTDIKETDWFAAAVLRTADILPGYEDGSFQPQQPILTAELLSALAGALELELPERPQPKPVDDTEEDAEAAADAAAEAAGTAWLEALRSFAAEQGWIPEEEEILPDNITRANAVVLINRALGRQPDTEWTAALKQDVFLDVDTADPVFAEILEAVMDHPYSRTEGEDEIWELEKPEFSRLTTGFHGSGNELYYVQADGNVLREPGFLRLGNQTYLVSEDDGRVYADEALHRIDGKVVFSGKDGQILKNGRWKDFRFDKDGFYTTGDADLDAYVENVIAECTEEGMTPMEELRACYDYVRAFRYLGRNAALPASVKTMPHEKAIGYAKKIFETGKGDCYNFTASFCFLARALGFDATAIVGRCGYVWSRSAIPHGWVEIVLDGETFLFDPQIENYNNRNGISNDEKGAFQVTYETAPARYYKN